MRDMMKFARRLSSLFALLLLSLTALLWIASVDVFAEDSYLYTVRVYAGEKGTFSDGSTEQILHFSYGEEANLGTLSITETDAAYRFTGFRISGRDNDTVSLQAFPVTCDVDYVAAYSIIGKSVNYTLNFVEYGSGASLAQSITMEGNVGDKPIAAYQYIEGYRPRYRNLTKTLNADPAENTFTFEYIAMNAEEAAGENAGGGAGNAGGGADGEVAGNGNQDDALAVGTQDINDLDVPLAGPGVQNFGNTPNGTADSNQQTDAAHHTSPVLWIISGVVVAAIIVMLIIILSRKKNSVRKR